MTRETSKSNPNPLDFIESASRKVTAALAAGVLAATVAGCAGSKATIEGRPAPAATATENKPEPAATELAERPDDPNAKSIDLSDQEIRGIEDQAVIHFNERTAALLSREGGDKLTPRVDSRNAVDYVDADGNVHMFISVDKADSGRAVLMAAFSQDAYRADAGYYGVFFYDKDSPTDGLKVGPGTALSHDDIEKYIKGANIGVYGGFFDIKDEEGVSHRIQIYIDDNGELSAVRTLTPIKGTANIMDATKKVRFNWEGGSE